MMMSAQKAALGLEAAGLRQAYSFRADPVHHGMGRCGNSALSGVPAGARNDRDLIRNQRSLCCAGAGRVERAAVGRAKVNVNGGAIALATRSGASGNRILVTLLHENGAPMRKKGLATLCIGGSMGVALALSVADLRMIGCRSKAGLIPAFCLEQFKRLAAHGGMMLGLVSLLLMDAASGCCTACCPCS